MATYYSKHNAGGGGVGSEPDPFTFQEGLDTTTSLDELRVLNTGVYVGAAAWDVDQEAGASDAPILIQGWASDDSGPDDVTMQNSAHGIFCSRPFVEFSRLHMVKTGGVAGEGFELTTGSDRCIVRSCSATGFARGFYGINAHGAVWVDCEAFANTTGFSSDTATMLYYYCRAHDNTGAGFLSGGLFGTAVRCISWDNGGDEWDITPSSVQSGIHLVGCIGALGTADGLGYTHHANGWVTVINCIFARCGGHGIDASAATFVPGFGNLIPAAGADANTAGSTNNVTFFMDALKANLTAAQIAAWLSVVDGAEDFRLGATSDALAGAWPSFLDIGPLQAEAAGAGGGLLVHPGMSGGARG